MKREYRSHTGLELREESGKPKLSGYAAVFNELSQQMMFFRERILPGAFTKSIETRKDVKAFLGHNSSQPLGRTTNGTLALRQDEKGLFIDIDPPDTTLGRDVVEIVRRRDIDQMSIGFVVEDDQWRTEDKEEIREIRSVDLWEVSIVAFPAYPQTSVALRSFWPDGIPEEIEKRQPTVVGQEFNTSIVIPKLALPVTESLQKKPSHARSLVEELERKYGLKSA